MIHVKKPKVSEQNWGDERDRDWADLVQEARVQKNKLIDLFNNGDIVEVDDKLYKRFMAFLLELFRQKCAYCESKIANTQPGDVEHFRPKGRVVDDNFKPIRVKHAVKGEINHPGYYWLAYDWSNLLPSCIDCNRFRKSGATAKVIVNKADSGAGKADRFPLEDETTRACAPDGETMEKALLINPGELDPADHLEFCSNGTIKPKTRRGETTLKVFGLNSREDLVEARRLAFKNAVSSFREWINSTLFESPDAKDAARRINSMWRGTEEYSAMHRLAIGQTIEGLKRSNLDIRLPLPE
jgi:hypothetical protein